MMTLQQMITLGILEDLAQATEGNATRAHMIVQAIGLPAQHVPSFGNGALNFWHRVCTTIQAGLHPGGQDLQPLVNAAAAQYPGRATLQQHSTQGAPLSQGPPSAPPARNLSLLVQGWDDTQALLATVQALPGGNAVTLSFSNAEGVFLNLGGRTIDQALNLEHQLQDQRQGIRTAVLSTPFQDYLLRLLVVGPDQARFEIPDVRASTRVKDIVSGIVGSGYSGKDKKGAPGRRIAQARHRDQSGKEHTLDPDATLHEEGVQDGDTLELGVESRAGAIGPAFREQALARAYHQVMRYARGHPGFAVSTNSERVPTEYTFEFSIPSFAPPSAKGMPPRQVNDHEVFLTLLAEFPMKAPQAFWQTPIFHPNIHRERGKVCLGILDDSYNPSMDFALLCDMLVNIAGFRNYAFDEAYDAEALHWVRSAGGQLAIARIGGHGVLHDFLDQLYVPRPMHIRRVQ
jgi:hypothetical protein